MDPNDLISSSLRPQVSHPQAENRPPPVHRNPYRKMGGSGPLLLTCFRARFHRQSTGLLLYMETSIKTKAIVPPSHLHVQSEHRPNIPCGPSPHTDGASVHAVDSVPLLLTCIRNRFHGPDYSDFTGILNTVVHAYTFASNLHLHVLAHQHRCNCLFFNAHRSANSQGCNL
jgi:hypothetical protein